MLWDEITGFVCTTWPNAKKKCNSPFNVCFSIYPTMSSFFLLNLFLPFCAHRFIGISQICVCVLFFSGFCRMEKQLVAIKQGCTLNICIFQSVHLTIDIKLSTSSSSCSIHQLLHWYYCDCTPLNVFNMVALVCIRYCIINYSCWNFPIQSNWSRKKNYQFLWLSPFWRRFFFCFCCYFTFFSINRAFTYSKHIWTSERNSNWKSNQSFEIFEGKNI